MSAWVETDRDIVAERLPTLAELREKRIPTRPNAGDTGVDKQFFHPQEVDNVTAAQRQNGRPIHRDTHRLCIGLSTENT